MPLDGYRKEMAIPAIDPAHLNLDKPLTELAHVYYVQLFDHETVAKSIQRIREAASHDRISYFYVTTKGDELVGVVPARRLLVAAPETLISAVMISPVISISENANLGEALELLANRRLMAVPIVDEENHLNGVIDLEHYTRAKIDLEQREAAETVFQLVGVHIENQKAGIWSQFRGRFPWLFCNIASGLTAAAITGAFDGVLRKTVALAFFFPLVLGIAESISMVAATLGIQQMHHHRRGILREFKIAPLLGAAAGLLVGSAEFFWLRSWLVGAVLAIAILTGALIGTLLGLFLPRLVHRWNLDPKIASGPAVLAITDILTLTAYLGLAAWILL
jgi:magnesium transporter